MCLVIGPYSTARAVAKVAPRTMSTSSGEEVGG